MLANSKKRFIFVVVKIVFVRFFLIAIPQKSILVYSDIIPNL